MEGGEIMNTTTFQCLERHKDRNIELILTYPFITKHIKTEPDTLEGWVKITFEVNNWGMTTL